MKIGNCTLCAPDPEFSFSSLSSYRKGNNEWAWREWRLKGRSTGTGKEPFITFGYSFETPKQVQQMAKPQFGKHLVEKTPGLLHQDFNFDSVSKAPMKFCVSIYKYRLEGEEINCPVPKKSLHELCLAKQKSPVNSLKCTFYSCYSKMLL